MLKFELIPYPPFSPDLVLSDFNFQYVKEGLKGIYFISDYEVVEVKGLG